jgi:hypothetical protein
MKTIDFHLNFQFLSLWYGFFNNRIMSGFLSNRQDSSSCLKNSTKPKNLWMLANSIFNNGGHVVSDEIVLSNFSNCAAGYEVDLLSF